MKRLLPIMTGMLVSAGFGLWFFSFRINENPGQKHTPSASGVIIPVTPTPTMMFKEPGTEAAIDIPIHFFQTFNNCGPATLAMVLGYYDISISQQELGQELRPYQNPAGDNDDKSVTLDELGAIAVELGLVAYHRPVGDIRLLKEFTSNGIPVITRTWTKVDEDIGHYRVVRGFDETQQSILQDDSLQGKDIRIPYGDFLTMWEKFNTEYLIVVPPEKTAVAEAILGEDVDPYMAWQKAADIARERHTATADDPYTLFNLSVALYHLEDYNGSIQAFEEAEAKLPFRTLWYQIEPLLSYKNLGMHDELLSRIDRILTNGNRAYSELYQIRGEIYQLQGNPEKARREFELARTYNIHFTPAQQALERME